MEENDKNSKSEKHTTHISNPLTMFGIFAGIAEIVGGVGLPFVSESNQIYLILFIIGFPILTICLFGYVLIRHPKNLYAPGDYRDDKSFLEALNITAVLTAANFKSNTDIEKSSMASQSISINEISGIVDKVFSENSTRKTSYRKNRILWVDDMPDNNLYEQEAFRLMGIDCSMALSTNEALNLLTKDTFTAIISDMGRKEGPREGYVLLKAIRDRGITTPFFIYSRGGRTTAHKEEARQKGAQGSTSSAQELFELVTNAIK